MHRKRRGGKVDDPLGDLADLSPLDLMVATAEIRQGWSPAEAAERIRPDWRPVGWEVPVVEVVEPEPVDK